MSDDFDTLTLELNTKREVAVLMYAIGNTAYTFQQANLLKGAAVCSNLQSRLCGLDPEAVADAIDSQEFTKDGVMAGEGAMSNKAGVARMADTDYVDPDEVNSGGL